MAYGIAIPFSKQVWRTLIASIYYLTSHTRQVFEEEDFGDELTSEMLEREAHLRAQAEQLANKPKH
ncbi:MAG: hypothetical protein ACRETA_10895 [Gammaproteobacteria bacterium]